MRGHSIVAVRDLLHPHTNICESSIMVVHNLPKVRARVRFSSLAYQTYGVRARGRSVSPILIARSIFITIKIERGSLIFRNERPALLYYFFSAKYMQKPLFHRGFCMKVIHIVERLHYVTIELNDTKQFFCMFFEVEILWEKRTHLIYLKNSLFL